MLLQKSIHALNTWRIYPSRVWQKYKGPGSVGHRSFNVCRNTQILANRCQRMSNAQPEVVISILNLNGKEVLKSCLRSLYETTDYDNFRVVVVDNGSTDGSVEMLEAEFPETALIENGRNKGYSKANNQVITRAKDKSADYVLLLNNDTEIVQENWLTRLVEVSERNQDLGVVGCKVVEPSGEIHYDGRYFPLSNFLYPWTKAKYRYNRHEFNNTDDSFEYIDEVVGAVFLIKMDLIETIGGLDEGYSPAYYEESDYCVRAWDAGYRVAYVPDVEVVHLRQQTSKQFDAIWIEHLRHRNNMRFMILHYPLSWCLIAIPFLILQTARMFLDYDTDEKYWDIQVREDVWKNPFKPIKYSIKSYLDVLSELPELLRERQNYRNIRDTVK